jgi:hypothetical protein
MRYVLILGILATQVLYWDAQMRDADDLKLITYVASGGSALQAISAIGRNSGVPIGVILGKEHNHLCEMGEAFKIVNASPRAALAEVAARRSYTLVEQSGVLILAAPDIEDWQSKMLEYRFPTYPSEQRASMQSLGVTLTGWIRMVLGHEHTFAASISSSPDARKYSLNAIELASIQDIADRIVSLPGGGIWVLKPSVQNPEGAQDEEVQVRSYVDDSSVLTTMDCGPH